MKFYTIGILIKKKVTRFQKIKFQKSLETLNYNDGGGGGIRTHERVAPLSVFKTDAFNRSATPPG